MKTLLKTIMEKLDDDSRKILFNDISELVKIKTGGLDFGFTIDDILKNVTPAEAKTQDQMDNERKEKTFNDSLQVLKKNLGGAKESGINVQEI